MANVIFDPFTVGDSKPVSVRVHPGDEITALSVTYEITRYKDPCGVIYDPGGACHVVNDNFGTTITTPDFIDFPTVDTYFVRFKIYWSDGQIDNSVVAQIPVDSVTGECC